MTAEFEPLLKQQQIEQFVSASQSTTIATNIFVSAGLMIFAMLITWMMIWSYQKDKFLFIAIICFISIMFCLEIIIIMLINMNRYDEVTFKLTMGSSVMMGLIYFILLIIFVVRYFQNQRANSTSSYVPSSVQNYIDQ